MRFLWLAIATVFSASACAASPRLHNDAMAFVHFWDANHDHPPAAQVAAFKTIVAPTFPAFYKAERFQSFLTPAQYDERIVTAVRDFPAIRTTYVQKAQQFGAQLPGYMASFKATFPDFVAPDDIYVVHSLGEMDGGMRAIDGKDYLIFGIDRMVQLRGDGDQSAFFHHELFHHYHLPRVAECGSNSVWSSLWVEGLATYVSKVLNPQANEKELLLTVPDDMAARTRAVLPAALAQLEGALDKDDKQTYADLFLFRGTAPLPRRRAYYLGYLMAQEAGKTHDVRQLANMTCAEVKPLVFATVHRLRENAR
ncbi:hypothetical protein NX784_04575 [Massilia pinisoli]|uniref:DUF2268 domain-containing protein n=1 Tax=Massilia pinisoli TaxID=1772194 RepID=A0ABT1ZLQ8_9BURK|nr:hypothetical protein [Massilia pinisoli]MCS0580855.1 hypothetical protein [Massilia pinisoli]